MVKPFVHQRRAKGNGDSVILVLRFCFLYETRIGHTVNASRSLCQTPKKWERYGETSKHFVHQRPARVKVNGDNVG